MLSLLCNYPPYPHHPQNYPQFTFKSADSALIYKAFVNFRLSREKVIHNLTLKTLIKTFIAYAY